VKFDDWLSVGLKKGWVGEPWCYVHGLPTLTDEEVAEVAEEGDLDAICLFVMRVMR
jgi:hypothetical protein